MKEFVFYYDVICPYAYLASRLIEGVAENVGAKIRWRPVLLGGIYKATKPEGEKTTKAYETMNSAKRQILGKDLCRLYLRHNVPVTPTLSMPDVSTLKPMRLLAACGEETSEQRKKLTHQLYHALWVEKKDISDIGVLQSEVSKINWDVDVNATTNGDDPCGKETLFANTQEAVERGAFGVPSFWVNDRLYFGCDRLDFLERELGNKDAEPYRLTLSPLKPIKKRKLTIFHDFASPWCFVTHRRMSSFLASLNPAETEVNWVPIFLGALFNAIRSPQVPMMTQGTNKRNYMFHDFHDWCKYLSINDFQFPSDFPHRTLTALRMTIANPESNLRAAFYESAWTKNMDIGNNEVLTEVVESAGFNADELFRAIQSHEIKDKLKENTDRAISLGACGVPSFQVDDQPILFGQDRLNIVADELCGWQDETEARIASRL